VTYTNREIIKYFVQGFCDMFEDAYRPSITVNYDWESRNLAQLKGAGESASINLSCYFSDSEVTSVHDVFFALMVAAHELAHWINRHNDQQDDAEDESVAIECWADYFGVKIIFAVLSPDSKLYDIIHRLMDDVSKSQFVQLYEGLSFAIHRLYKVYYHAGENKDYPAPGYRASLLCSSAILAVAKRIPKFDEKIANLLNIILANSPDGEAYPYEDIGIEEERRLSDICIRIHSRLLQEDRVMRRGIKIQHMKFLNLHYHTIADLELGMPEDPYEDLSADEAMRQFILNNKL
jgi:hypothetical protein